MPQYVMGSQWTALEEEPSSGESEMEVDELMSLDPTQPSPKPNAVPKTPSPAKKRKRSPEPSSSSTQQPKKNKFGPGSPGQVEFLRNFLKSTPASTSRHDPGTPSTSRATDPTLPATPTRLPPARNLIPSPLRNVPPLQIIRSNPSTPGALLPTSAPTFEAVQTFSSPAAPAESPGTRLAPPTSDLERTAPSGPKSSGSQTMQGIPSRAPPAESPTRPASLTPATQRTTGKSFQDAISLSSDGDDGDDNRHFSTARPSVARPPATVRRNKPTKSHTSTQLPRPSTPSVTSANPFGSALPTPVTRRAAHAVQPRPQPARRPPSPSLDSVHLAASTSRSKDAKGKGRAVSQSSSDSLPSPEELFELLSPKKKTQERARGDGPAVAAASTTQPSAPIAQKPVDEIIDLTMSDDDTPPSPQERQSRRADPQRSSVRKKIPITGPPDVVLSTDDEEDDSPRRPTVSSTPKTVSTEVHRPQSSSSSKDRPKPRPSTSSSAQAARFQASSSKPRPKPIPWKPASASVDKAGTSEQTYPPSGSTAVKTTKSGSSTAVQALTESTSSLSLSGTLHVQARDFGSGRGEKSPSYGSSSADLALSTSNPDTNPLSMLTPGTTPSTLLSPDCQMFRQPSLTSNLAMDEVSSFREVSEHLLGTREGSFATAISVRSGPVDESSIHTTQTMVANEETQHVTYLDSNASSLDFVLPTMDDFAGLGDLPVHEHVLGLSREHRNPDQLLKLFKGLMLEATIETEPSAPDLEIIRDANDPCMFLWRFVYSNKIRHGPGVPVVDESKLEGCDCEGPCEANPECACAVRQAELSGDEIPYFAHDRRERLIATRPQIDTTEIATSIIRECNSHCKCSVDCPNRVIERGRQVKVQLRKTDGKGWGVFAGQKIPRGTFIGIYAGELLTEDMAEKRGFVYDSLGSTYIFDLDFGHLRKADGADVQETSSPNERQAKKWKNLYAIDAFRWGNFTRFLNHSCDPNCGIHAAYTDEPDIQKPLLAFYTCKDVPQGEELSFSYSGDSSALTDPDSDDEGGSVKTDNSTSSVVPRVKTAVHRPCLCKAPKCKGRMWS